MTHTNTQLQSNVIENTVLTSYEGVGLDLCNAIVNANKLADDTKLNAIIMASSNIKTTDQLNQVFKGFNDAIKLSDMVETSKANRKTEIKAILTALHTCPLDCRNQLLAHGVSWQALVNGARNWNSVQLSPLQISERKEADAEKAKAEKAEAEAKAKAEAEALASWTKAEAEKAEAEKIANMSESEKIAISIDSTMQDNTLNQADKIAKLLELASKQAEAEKAEAEAKAEAEKAETEKAEAEAEAKTEADIMQAILNDLHLLAKFNNALSKKLLAVISKA